MRRRSKVLLAIAVLLIGIQLVPVSRDNPPVTAAVETPAEVQTILETSCYDCHSNLTRWPWYSRVAPVSWLIHHDVSEGRDQLNFSEWGDYPARRQNHKLEELEEMIRDGKMPLKKYVPLHPEARLSAADAETLIEWSKTVRAVLEAESGPFERRGGPPPAE